MVTNIEKTSLIDLFLQRWPGKAMKNLCAVLYEPILFTEDIRVDVDLAQRLYVQLYWISDHTLLEYGLFLIQ